MPGKCTCNPIWEKQSEFEGWIKPCTGDTSKAYCKICSRSFDISNMGVAAVKSHSASVRHVTAEKKNVDVKDKNAPITFFFKGSQGSDKTPVAGPSNAHCDTQPIGATACTFHTDTSNEPTKESSSKGLQSFVMQQKTLNSEIYWASETVMSHQSFNSNQNKPELFRAMFPDSKIAMAYSMKATKCSYLVTYGIAPYIEKKLVDDVKKAQFYAVSFDEAMNSAMQQKQMDLLIRYWDGGKITTRYIGSQFMGHGTADDLCKHIEEGLKHIGLNKLLQVSMDGPAVNWSFFEKMCE